MIQRRFLLPALLTVPVVVLALTVSLDGNPVSELWAGLMFEIQAQQRTLHRGLVDAIQTIQTEGPLAAWGLISLSFLYGIFHAAGPGHGKIVISTYLATQKSQLGRGIFLSVLSAFIQGLSAIVLVVTAVTLFQISMRKASAMVGDLETMSYALIAGVGLYLVGRQLRRLIKARKNDHHHDHGHHHDHPHDHGVHAACCGHSHGPTPEQLKQRQSWWETLAVAGSIGIRPCTGAVLVLVLALSLDLFWAGIAAVMAMSLGTAITVSALATGTVFARQATLAVFSGSEQASVRTQKAMDWLGLIGGATILIMGILLVQADLTAPAHPLR